jgi:uncharacterized spore protein YtfJ
MSEIKNELFLKAVESPSEGLALLEKLSEAASPEAVFGKPIQQGDTTIITANAVSVGLGFGLGGSLHGKLKAENENYQEVNGGGGGGGSTRSQPVAVISISPDGVKVEPIFDFTRIFLAFLSTMGALFIAIGKIKKMNKL